MRTVMPLLFAALFTVSTVAQPSAPKKICAKKVTILSSGLPDSEQRELVRQLQGCNYNSQDAERLRADLQDLGYYKAEVGDPTITPTGERENGWEVVDLNISVKEGPKYYVSKIAFRNLSVFPTDQVRALFPKDGDLFNRTAIGKSLEALRHLYGSIGYVNFTSVPDVVVDEKSRSLTLIVDIDEGMKYRFGSLILDRSKPEPELDRALLESWASLSGKPYNLDALFEWLQKNRSKLPPPLPGLPPYNLIENSPDRNNATVDVRIWFP